MSFDQITQLELEVRNLALNELLDRTIQGLSTDPAELRKTLKLHYLRQFLNTQNVSDGEQESYIRRLKMENHVDTIDLHSDISEWVTNQQYHPRNIIAVVTRGLSWGDHPYANTDSDVGEPPEDLDLMDQMIKAVIELHPTHVDGLHTGFGGQGISWVNPNIKASFSVIEKYGRAIDKLLHLWYGRHCAWHNLNCVRKPQTPSQSSVTIDVMFIEPDPTHTAVVMAWKGSNLYPGRYSGIRSKRSLSDSRYGEIEQLGFELWGDYTTGQEVMDEAQAVLNGFALIGANPYTSKEFVDSISDDVMGSVINRL